MKPSIRWVRVGVLVILLSLTMTTQASVGIAASTAGDSSTTTRGGLQTVVKAIGTYQDLKQTIREKNIALNFEENLEFPSLKEMARIDATLSEKNSDLEAILIQFSDVLKRTNSDQYDDSDEQVIEDLLWSIQEDIDRLQIERSEYEETYEGRKTRQQTNIRSLRQELEDLNEEVLKQRQIIWSQANSFVTYLLVFLAIAVLFVLLKLLGRMAIWRMSKKLTEARIKTLLQMNNIIFNALLAVVVLAVVFSQFVNFLPFVAILGTAIAFAIRDTISSFIAWFVVGTDRGYKVGDILEIGAMKGKVLEIKPILTALVDMSPGWNTGKIVTMPNKVIFEDKIYNHSRCGGLVQQTLHYVLTPESDLMIAKDMLIKAIIAETPSTEERHKTMKKTAIQCHQSEEEMQPKVWGEWTLQGLELHARCFCPEEQSEDLKHGVQERFMLALRTDDRVTWQFVAKKTPATKPVKTKK